MSKWGCHQNICSFRQWLDTFILFRRLAVKIRHARGDKANTLPTLNKENKLVDTKVATLSVSDINNENTLTLNTVYARKQLPIHEENIPSPKDI